MNEIIQNLEIDCTNGDDNYCRISEKKLEAIKALAKIEEQELSKYKSKLDDIYKCYNEVLTKIEEAKKDREYLSKDALLRLLNELKDIIKFYIPEVRICDGSEGTE